MDKNVENMTDEQKKIYYVTKIAKLSSDEYKIVAGSLISLVLSLKDLLCDGVQNEQMISLVPAAIAVYCGITHFINRAEQDEAAAQLAELNKTEGRSK